MDMLCAPREAVPCSSAKPFLLPTFRSEIVSVHAREVSEKCVCGAHADFYNVMLMKYHALSRDGSSTATSTHIEHCRSSSLGNRHAEGEHCVASSVAVPLRCVTCGAVVFVGVSQRDLGQDSDGKGAPDADTLYVPWVLVPTPGVPPAFFS